MQSCPWLPPTQPSLVMSRHVTLCKPSGNCLVVNLTPTKSCQCSAGTIVAQIVEQDLMLSQYSCHSVQMNWLPSIPEIETATREHCLLQRRIEFPQHAIASAAQTTPCSSRQPETYVGCSEAKDGLQHSPSGSALQQLLATQHTAHVILTSSTYLAQTLLLDAYILRPPKNLDRLRTQWPQEKRCSKVRQAKMAKELLRAQI